MKKPEEFVGRQSFSFEDLNDIMKILLSPVGCPWDREQTHASIREDLLEEAYEAAEAIDLNAPDMLCEELGDVLLQVVFHAALAESEGAFSVDSVINGICSKLIERHPHVFGQVRVSGSEEVLSNWDAIKQKSKNRKNIGEELDGICRALPALMRAEKIAHKLRRRGIVPVDEIGKKQLSELSSEEIGGALYYIAARADSFGVSAEEKLQRYNESLVDESKSALKQCENGKN